MKKALFALLAGILLAGVLLAGCATATPNPETTSPNATPTTARVLLIAQEKSEDMEFMLTEEVGVMVSMLEEAGYAVEVASLSGEPIRGTKTFLTPDMKLADVKIDDYAGLLLPCMAVPLEPPWPPVEAIEIIKQAAVQGKPIAAQLGGVVMLNVAGVLDGKQFAIVDGLQGDMPEGIYKGEGVVQDGNIITSGICPFMAREMGKTNGTSELTQKFIDTLNAAQ